MFGFLLLLWVSIWILDFTYYNRLLLGATDALLKIEELSERNNTINSLGMSRKIEAAVHGAEIARNSSGVKTGRLSTL